jgi:hypothetical protein
MRAAEPPSSGALVTPISARVDRVCHDVLVDQAEPVRGGDRLGATVDTQLRQNVLKVNGDGLRADNECRSNLLLRASRSE